MARTILFSLLTTAVAGALWAGPSALAATTPPQTAAMPVQVDGSSLTSEAPFTATPAARPKLNVSGVFAPAPMPDQDVDPPAGGTGSQGASVTPALFSHKAEFAGDGYASASDSDHGLDHRRSPAAGLNWSVPVK